VFNTLVDNRVHYQMDGRAKGLGATHTTFANNVVVGGGPVAKIDGPNVDAIWIGNLLWKTGDAGDLPNNGYSNTDPLLVRDPNGIYRPQPESPAINSATGDYPAVLVDLDGQPRPKNKKTIGADELSTAPVIAHLLSPTEVGPSSR
jgi:hypothetical protein